MNATTAAIETRKLLTRASFAGEEAIKALGLQSVALYDEDIQTAQELRIRADEALQRSLRNLNEVGEQVGCASLERKTLDPIPLDLLSTPASRRLLDLLEEAQAVADQVDAERGRALDPAFPVLPGESRGVDLAESISTIVLRLRLEVVGPVGRD